MMATAETRTVWQLARLAGVSDPDSLESAGAKWLTRVHDSAVEICEYSTDAITVDDVDDAIHEQADSLVPVYTHHRWQVFADLAAYEVDVADLVGGGEDMTTLAGFALYEVARTLLAELVTEVLDERAADAEDES